MRFPDVEPFKEEALSDDGKKAALKVLEESAELVEAVKGWLSADPTTASITPDHMLEEMGDVLPRQSCRGVGPQRGSYPMGLRPCLRQE